MTYECVEIKDRENPYGDRIQLYVGLKDTDTGKIVAKETVGLKRHQLENYDMRSRLKRYKERLKAKIDK